MKNILYFALFTLAFISCKKNDTQKDTDKVVPEVKKTASDVKITPVSHATAVLEFNDEIIYLDPTGGKTAFDSFKKPTYVLITDIHGDHMNVKTLNELDLSNTTIIAPQAVADNLKTVNVKDIVVINNDETKSFSSFSVEAIPMYNLREEALKFHPKGRGNGYVLTVNNERLYFSGDTEDIPEMRALKNIDKAFICMNLPYTMTVESAADAVLAFAPNQVFPYHYRGTGGLSDVAKFKKIVSAKNKQIEVTQLNWYPNRK